MALIDRIIVVCLTSVLFLLPWHTAYIIQSAAVGTVGTVSVTLIDCIFVFLSFVVIMREWGRVRCCRLLRSPLNCIALLLVVYVFASVLWSGYQSLAVLGAVRLLEALVVFGLLVRYRAYAAVYVVAIVSAAGLQSLFAIGQFIFQESPAFSWLGLAYHGAGVLGDAVVEIGDQRWLRAYGAFPHPNILAAFLSFALFACLWLVRYIRQKNTLWICIGVWSSIVVGLFLTFSREVWIGTLAGFLLLVIVHRKSRWHGGGISPYVLMGISSVIIVACLSIVYWEPLSGRLGVGGWQRLEQKSLNERMASYKDGLSLVASSPLIGKGMYQSPYALYERDKASGRMQSTYAYQPPHNVFLLMASELGLIGLILVLLSMAALLVRYFTKYYTLETQKIFLGALVMAGVAGMFDHFFWTDQSGLILWWMSFAFLFF